MTYDPDHYVLCPMQDCGEPLTVDWSLAMTLDPRDMSPDAVGGLPAKNAHTATWQVECYGGHVLLMPGYTGCPCEDGDGPNCPHDPIDFDWSEDSRTFQAHDMRRLLDVLALLRGEKSDG